MQESMAVTAAEAMDERCYVKVGTRFYRVTTTMRPSSAVGGAGVDDVARRRRPFHYLESCFLCKRTIACDRDVFMYKGDAALCSEECREEQMGMDEALHAAARRHRLLLLHLRSPAAEAASTSSSRPPPPPVMRRRPTIANLAAARHPPVAAS